MKTKPYFTLGQRPGTKSSGGAGLRFMPRIVLLARAATKPYVLLSRPDGGARLITAAHRKLLEGGFTAGKD